MSDPYSLPCGHTYCLQPCLLSDARAVAARCIHCHVEFDVAKLRPNYNAELRIRRFCLQQGQEQPKKQPVWSKKAGKEILTTIKGTKETAPSFTYCSACRSQIQSKLLVYCHHCHCKVCVQCREKHRASFCLMLRVKLHALSGYKVQLKSRLDDLKKSKAPKLGTKENKKDELVDDLENAVFELHAAASKALDAATAKVEGVDLADFEIIDGLVRRISILSTEVGMKQDAHKLLKGIRDLQEAAATRKLLKRLLVDVAPLGEMVKKLPPLLITQMQLSDRLGEIGQQLNNFSLVVCDGLVSIPQLPRLSPRCNIGDDRNVSSSATTTTTSRVKLYLVGLLPNHTESQLKRHFAQYGTVTECCVARDWDTEESKGFGYVTFEEEAQATLALNSCPHFIEGDFVHVKPFKSKTNKESEVETSAVSSSAMVELEAEKEGDRNVPLPVTTTTTSRVKLYLVGLLPNHTESQLERHFAQYGTVTECCVARDWVTEESKGFGYVTFRRRAQAARALSDSPHLIEGGFVHVKPFKSKTSKGNEVEKSIVSFSAIDADKVGNKGDGSDAVGNGKVNELRLFVGNLNPSTTQQSLKKYFSRYGTITSVDMIPERESGKPRGIAFVNMTTPLEVEAILNAGLHQLSGRNVVRRAFSRTAREAATSNDAESGQLVVVKNVPSFWSKDDIQLLFSRFGVITNVRVDEEVGKVLIEFSTAQAVDNLRKKKFNHIIEKYYLTSPSDDGTCSIISDFCLADA
ncbi:unnamed protein product [Taenia asiatica]|uniref:RRM domain-containing protein n=1 Tax=Taenia asiatica TaxID=60517 RepID=A0A0R3WE44_TAEAS|nr:unnamed protein product [Taenia asiatica]